MDMSKKSLYFIPDITGFTSFVKSVEVEHSQHIISELLELIIDADDLELSVAEVEGDAVFFYKQEDVPGANDILKQIQKTYVRFHEHLKLYQTRRICDCGACTTAVNLSLKFIVHEGDLSMITVKGKEKPFGEDVIRIHKLLKNSIAEKEYLLYTKDMLDKAALINGDEEWSNVAAGMDDYEDIGEISYKSIGLSFLKSLVANPPPLEYGKFKAKPIKYSVKIKSDKTRVYELVTNMEHRHKWTKNPPEFRFKKDTVNRVGSKHICVIGNTEIEFETVTQDFGNEKLVHGEKTTQIPFLREATSYYIIEGDEKETSLRVEYHYEALPFLGWLVKLLFARRVKKGLKESLNLLKEIAEAEKE